MAKGGCTSGIYCFSFWLALLLALAASQNNSTEIPEINSSILVYGPSDYVQQAGVSRCQQVVKNALSYKQSNLMFVPTAFWVDEGYLQRKSVNSQACLPSSCPNSFKQLDYQQYCI